MLPGRMGPTNCASSAPPVFTRNLHINPSERVNCSRTLGANQRVVRHRQDRRMKTAQAYRRQYGFRAISVMPTNLYGPNDNYDLTSSHVLPALIRKFHEAKIAGSSMATVWGTGEPRREFLHVDDLADAIVFLMLTYDDEEIINIGTGEDLTIRELSRIVKEVSGFEGEVFFDAAMPDGTPRKLLDVSRLFSLGWRPRISLRAGMNKPINGTCSLS